VAIILLKVLAGLLLGWGGGWLVNWLADTLPCENKPRPRLRSWLVLAAATAGAIWLTLAPPARFLPPPSLASPGRFDLPWGLFAAYLLLLYLLLVVVIDIEHRLILHKTSLFGALLCGAIGTWLRGPLSTLAGGLAGLIAMLLVYFLGKAFVRLLSRLRGREINEEAMGFGDVLLAGVMGLLLGWPGVFSGLVYTFIFGGVGSLAVLLAAILSRRSSRDLTLAYGPYLALAMFLLIFIL